MTAWFPCVDASMDGCCMDVCIMADGELFCINICGDDSLMAHTVSNTAARSHDMKCDIAELNVPETGDMSLNFSRARGGNRGSSVYSPLHTVMFIESQQDRWRFQSERNQCLCRQRQPEHPRGVAQSVEKVLQSPLKTAFSRVFSPSLFTSSVSHGAILCERIIKAHYLKMCFCAAHPARTTVDRCKKVSRVLFSLVASFIKQDEEKCPCMPPVQLLQRLSPPLPPPQKSCCLSASVFLPATLFLISRASEETDKVQNPKLTVCLYSAETRKTGPMLDTADLIKHWALAAFLSCQQSHQATEPRECEVISIIISNCYFLHYLYEVLHSTWMGGLDLVFTGLELSVSVGRSLCCLNNAGDVFPLCAQSLF